MQVSREVEEFVSTFITDETVKARVIHVFSALPEDIQQHFLRDPGFSIGMPDWGTRALIGPPQGSQGSRLVLLKSSLRHRSRAFALYVIAHELAHAFLRNRGRSPEEDPEIAADSIAAEWGFPRPSSLPLL